ncbi:hypothetical protein GGX14DRAFT_388474 [Mycena pura]|uniref:Uncharacterized protein n=1 Tax=Mycena pura TaxID=153505 RepID=A0AAD6VS88_9AGAR|nr:hypothetical protein GGX14DRAFT_388474 [Mycena pura]
MTAPQTTSSLKVALSRRCQDDAGPHERGAIRRILERSINKIVPNPAHPNSRILDFFGNDSQRAKALDELYMAQGHFSGRFEALQRHCHGLLKYTLPESTTVDTQLMTFKILISVITRYPGVRSIFWTHKALKKVSKTDPSSLSSLWDRPYQSCTEEWVFYRDLAAFSLSQSHLTKLVEDELPSKLSRVELDDSWNVVPIEQLLWYSRVRSSTGPELDFPRLCAIRYLGGILELPDFWHNLRPNDTLTVNEDPNVERERFFQVLCNLCQTVLLVIQDTRSLGPADAIPPPYLAGRIIVDMFSWATLSGVYRLCGLNQLHGCPEKLPRIIQDIVHAVLSCDMKSDFPWTYEAALAVSNLLTPAPGSLSRR